MNSQQNNIINMPMLALRGLVLFPEMLLHFDVGRKKSVLALEAAMTKDQTIFLVSQQDMRDDEPELGELYEFGCVAQIKQVLKMPGESFRILVKGVRRARILEITQSDPHLTADILQCEDKPVRKGERSEKYISAMIRNVREAFDRYCSLSPKVAPDVVLNIGSLEHPGILADFTASNIMLDPEDKQAILSELNPVKRLELLLYILMSECDILSLESQIHNKVREQIDENNREYYLREQMKAISTELGDYDTPQGEAEIYRLAIKGMKLEPEVEEKLYKEADRLYRMPQGSHEANVVRNYLDLCIELPWDKSTKDKLDIARAQNVLDRDHYGLDKVKKRIVESLSVRKLAADFKGQILCLVGPPGVGKTSIAKSIARAMGRKYVRVSLGGVRDEAEIRGHRKTYIGAMPGRIITAIKQAGVNNPVLLLDEVDKLCRDAHGDPSSALLEALDSEQNFSFRDHFLEMPFDLSGVFFITTANTVDTIPDPLLDRMEIITLSSYVSEEKFHIARKYLLPKQVKRHGLNGRIFRMTDGAVRLLIEGYTREAGVRSLEREIASVCRKAAKMIVLEETQKVKIDETHLKTLLGPEKYQREELSIADEIGSVSGLAWTRVGGEVMPIEVAVLDGSGKLELTGSLGKVMKESAHAAISYIRARTHIFGIPADFYKKKDIHIHAPEGAVPKDGPSAGITICTAVVSALCGIPVFRDVAMTGEITLRGNVLPIGGLKEKVTAAYRQGIKTIIIPQKNAPDLEEIDSAIKSAIRFIPVSSMDTVLSYALTKPFTPVVTSGLIAADIPAVAKQNPINSGITIQN